MLNNINNYILLILINTMGRGAHAAHAAYNGSGTQGISVTNKINENEDIHSVFITQNDTSRQILHGHNISEMTCAGKTEGIDSERYKIFTPDENIDMLGDIYLNFEMDSEISGFEFVDTSPFLAQSVEYPLQDLTQSDLTTSFMAGGTEAKTLDLDLMSGEIPNVETLNLSMSTIPIINRFRSFQVADIKIQFAVGAGEVNSNNNFAWRKTSKSSPNQYGDWYYGIVPELSEINDVIYDPKFNDGSIIFGGNVKRSRRGSTSGLYFITIDKIVVGQATPIKELSISAVKGGVSEYKNEEIPADKLVYYTHYITVNNLTYLETGGFIASGRKYYEPDEFSVVHPEYHSLPWYNFDESTRQTSKIFNLSTFYNGQYFTYDMTFALIHNGAANGHKFTSNPDITSSTIVNEEGGTSRFILSCGSRYNTILGLDTEGLIIKSYDNGKTWEYADFYYGSQAAENNYENGTRRRSKAYNLENNLARKFDKGIYIDNSKNGEQDPDFDYFMPRVSHLHTNNTGVWTAIGQQGIQDSNHHGNNRYRQFVFRSIDDGESWHPIRVYAFPNKCEINHVQFNSIDVDYISIYTANRESCKILMSVPPQTTMASVFVRSNWETNWKTTAVDDLIESNEDQPPDTKTYVLLNIPTNIGLPWLGNVIEDEGVNMLASRETTDHRLTPWFGEVDAPSNSGLYRFDDDNMSGGNAVDLIRYEYLGAITDGKKDILFGKNVKSVDSKDENIGIVTILATRSRPHKQDTLSDVHLRYPTEAITVSLGLRRIIQSMVSTSLGMTAILKDENVANKYEILRSYDGFVWITLKVINGAQDVPKIESDISDNIIYLYKDTSESYYKIFKITPTDEISEINVLSNVFTDINGLNYGGTEWWISGVGDYNMKVIGKSYDTIKWRKPSVSDIYPAISSIVIKKQRLYETLVYLDERGSTYANEYKKKFKTYEVCHSDERSNFQGLGIRAYGMQDLNFSSGIEAAEYPSQSIKINNIKGDITNSSSTSANDIIETADGSIIICGEDRPLENSGSYYHWLPRTGEGDEEKELTFINLAEGPGDDGLTFIEASTIYRPLANSNLAQANDINTYMGITNFSNSFNSFHDVKFSEHNILAIGKAKQHDPTINDGLLALRYIPSPQQFSNLTPKKYYWKFIFGSTNPILSEIRPTWDETPFETIHDVFTTDSREIVVVGKPKNGNSPIYYEKPDTITSKTFRGEWIPIPFVFHGFSEVLSVCYTGTRWIFGGIPSLGGRGGTPGQTLAYTTELLNLEKWVKIDVNKLPIATITKLVDESDEATSHTGTYKTYYDTQYIKYGDEGRSHYAQPRANHVRPVDYKGISGVIVNMAMIYDEPGKDSQLQEYVYFMYENGDNVTIEQNLTWPGPKISFTQQLSKSNSIFTTDKHEGSQFRPTWETYIDGTLRTLFTTVYPSEYNQFVVDVEKNENGDDKFVLKVYSNPLTEDAFADHGTNVQRRYRKFITTDTFSLRNRIAGNCYKIQKVKNENFVTGLNSTRYLAVGKGVTSPIVKSDDLVNWTDVDVKDIFTIVFDIVHKSGIWVAVGEGNYNLAISKDGKIWKGIYSEGQNNSLSSYISSGVFNSVDYDIIQDNVTDVLPYIPSIKGIFLRNLSILRLFSRIEYHVGTQIWQTLTFDDIKAMLDTEFGAGEYKNLLKNCSIINKNGSTRLTTWIPGFTKTLNSKLETFSNISESGSFPSGLLKDQKLSIKIYYNKLENILESNTLDTSDMNNAFFDNLMNNTLIPTDRDTNYIIDSFLADNYGFQLGDTYRNVNGHFELKFSTEIQNFRLFTKRFELDDVEIDEFNKGVKQTPKITQSLYFDADNVGYLLLDLDSFNLYASHIIVSGWLTSGVYITNMNLELNGYSYQKIIEPSVIDYATKSFLGLNYNRYTFNGIDKEDGTGSLVIPLASTAYSGSSVPLDRYNSIRLRINFNTLAGPKSYINVTCVGTTTISYNNNTANIDLY